MIRQILAAVAVVGALLTAVTLGFPDVGRERSADVAAVLLDDLANNSRAQGAPQQAVVNGWVARDLLTLEVDRSDILIAQQKRTNQLLAVGMLVIALTTSVMVLRPYKPAPSPDLQATALEPASIRAVEPPEPVLTTLQQIPSSVPIGTTVGGQVKGSES